MKNRLLFLLTAFIALLLIFILQKPLFMLYAGAISKGYSFIDFIRVVFHGTSLDVTTAAYVLGIPWLVVLVSWWKHKRPFPLRKILAPYFVIVSFILAAVFAADSAVYPFWGFKLDASIFLYMDSPKNVAASVSPAFLTLGIAAIFVFAALYALLLIRLTPLRLPPVKMLSDQLAGTLVSLLLGGLLFLAVRGGVKESTANVGQVYFCNDEFLNHSAINPAFSLLYSATKTKDYAARCNYFPEEERASLFDGLYPTSEQTTLRLLNCERPNVLIIILEGFGASMVESLGGIPGASPNIDRLSREGVWFTRCYAGSFRTDRGTVCTLSGYLSFPDVSVMKVPAKSRSIPVVAQKLQSVGYATDFVYGGDINFTNMRSYLLQGGYQRLTSDVDFSMQQRKNPWGADDDVTFSHLLSVISQRQPADGPWHTTFLTLSSHEPFQVPYSRLQEPKPNAFAYTDQCLGDFVDRLKTLPQWNDLLIVILPDHGFLYPEGQLSANDMAIHHIPMLWLGGAIKKPVVIDKLMCQTDMVATLLAQLGIPHDEFNFSRNILGEEYKYPFVYYTYNGGFAFADSTGYTLYNIASDMITDQDSSQGSQQRVRLGKAILQSSYDDLGAR